MSQIEPSQQLKNLKSRFGQIAKVLNSQTLDAKIQELEGRASEHNLWNDQKNAQRLTAELSHAKALSTRLTRVEQLLEDTSVLLELAANEDDVMANNEALADIVRLENFIGALETETLLSGEYDSRAAIMTIRSGAGGDDATDFSEMLMRLYLRYAEIVGMKTTVLETSYAEGGWNQVGINQV